MEHNLLNYCVKKEIIDNITISTPPKIPRPPNAFMLYATDNRKVLSHKYPADSNKIISKKLGSNWKSLTPDEKNKYFDKARIVAIEHKEKYPDYVYNPKEARLRKAMREAANRDRSIGASPMLPRPSARRAASSGWATTGGGSVPGGPVTPTSHGRHEEPLIMSPLGQGMRGPGMDSPCFPSGMSSTSGGINGSGSEQFMPPSMGAAPPAPGYITTKMDQVSPLPPPPAPTPGVHAPYMQTKSKTDSKPNEETLTFRIQLERDSKKKEEKKQLKQKIIIDEEDKRKNVLMAIKKRLMDKQKSKSISDEQETNTEALQTSDGTEQEKSKIDQSPATDISTNIIAEARKPRVSIIEAPYKQSKMEQADDRRKLYPAPKSSFTGSYRQQRVSRSLGSKRSSKIVEAKTLVFEEEDEEKKPLEEEERSTKQERQSSVSMFSYEINEHDLRKLQRSEAIRRDRYRPEAEILNVVGREKKRQEDRKQMINRMRKNLPSYDLMQIRELRLPFHEAVFVNMEDNSYTSAVAFGKQLLAYQDNMRKEAPQGSTVFIKPLLKFSKEEFTTVMQSLKQAEDFHRANKLMEECDAFLKLAITFAFQDTDDWWWLGEQLLLQLIKTSSAYSAEIGGKFEAFTRYTYGRYLLEKLKEFKNASTQLKISRLLSQGKGWSCKAYFPELRGTLFMQCNHGIYDCMAREVKFYMSNFDYGKAIILADQARKRAAEACYRNGETQALVLRGICEMETDHIKSAISSLLRAYNIQERFGNVEGLCKIRIHLAKAYLMDKCANSSLNVLLELKKDAEQHNLPYYLGLAYKNLGQYYLLIGENGKAFPLLQESLKIFKKCDNDTPAFKEIQSAKTLKEISGGLQLFPKFVDLLLDVARPGYIGQSCLKAMLLWKENRTEFWTEYDDLIAYDSCEDILLESMRRVAHSRADFLDARLKEVAGQ